ncbi:hypothetical protein AB0478_18445 [Streptomyces sp. NPDC051917]|uniref:Acg family FMN-binding oxidoreductase n=1 Tax=Streptomyces sp. NPDC051917 TaxID=3154754 RepID=UPI00344D62C0
MPNPGLDATALETLLAAAVAAPSIHNTQPWRFRLNPANHLLEVRALPERSLPLADPDGRARHLSVGAAVFNIRLAAVHLGRHPAVRLLPDPGEPELLAAVELTRPPRPEDGRLSEPDLYAAIARRHTSRMPFTGRPVPDPIVAELAVAAHAEGARLHTPDFVGIRRLLRVTALAEARNHAGPARTAETRSWITPPGADTPYGIPLTALGPADAAGRLPMRDFTGPLRAPHPPAPRFERHVQATLLWTSHDRPEDWLRAGQALQHVLLTATMHGVRTSLLHQAMEWPDLRAACSLGHQRCHPQVLIRYGYGPDGGRTPRASAQTLAPSAELPDPTGSLGDTGPAA